MRQQFQYLTTAELKALHGDDFLRIVIATRSRIQKMDPERVAKAINRTMQCVLDFVSGTTRVPRSSTLSAMLEHIVAVDDVVDKPVVADRPSKTHHRLVDFRKKIRYVRPVRRSVERGQKRA